MNWKIDVQRGLAWVIMLSFVGVIVMFSLFASLGKLPDPILDLYKQNGNALINIVMVVVGYFFGSSQGSKDKDEAVKDVVARLAPGPNGGGQTVEIAAAAAAAAAPAAAAAVAPAAAAEAAPPAAAEAAPPAVEAALAERGIPPKE